MPVRAETKSNNAWMSTLFPGFAKCPLTSTNFPWLPGRYSDGSSAGRYVHAASSRRNSFPALGMWFRPITSPITSPIASPIASPITSRVAPTIRPTTQTAGCRCRQRVGGTRCATRAALCDTRSKELVSGRDLPTERRTTSDRCPQRTPRWRYAAAPPGAALPALTSTAVVVPAPRLASTIVAVAIRRRIRVFMSLPPPDGGHPERFRLTARRTDTKPTLA
jgi:hypothetical protein